MNMKKNDKVSLNPQQQQKINSFLKVSSTKTRNVFSPAAENTKKKTFLIENYNSNVGNPELINSENFAKEYNLQTPKRGSMQPSQSKKTPIIYTQAPSKILTQTTTEPSEILDGSYDIIEPRDCQISGQNENENNFCSAVFIAGLSSVATEPLDIGSEFAAPCGHKECALLGGISSQILHVYTNNNKNLPEINNAISSMCFPLGIKLCYHCSIDKKKKISHIPRPNQTFFNVIKNAKEEIFYVATLHYFVKLSKKDYESSYLFNPLQSFIDKQNSNKNVNMNDKKTQEIFQTISQFVMNDSVLVPESVSLISKYPYYSQMDTCLKCIISLPKAEMNLLIAHIVNEVPLPPVGKQIMFYIPRTAQVIRVYNHNDHNVNISGLNYSVLFDHMNVESILIIFHLILLEQKILIIDNNYKLLSEISYLFISLIYPFSWVNPYIPILSLSTVKFLQSFIPFIFGIDEYLLKFADKKKYMKENNDVVFYLVNKGVFSLCKTRKKVGKKDILRELKLPDLPEKVYSYLYKNLRELKKLYEKKLYDNNKEKLNTMIMNLFIKGMIMLIGDYKNFTFLTAEDMPLFNKEAFINGHPNRDMKMFLTEMTSTQIFNQFLFNEKENNYSNTKYFMEMISKNADLVNVQQVRQRSTSASRKRRKSSSRNADKNQVVIQSHINSSFHSKNNESFGNISVKGGFRTGYSIEPSIPIKRDKFLLTPYFITNSMINTSQNKIEEYISTTLKKKGYKDINAVEQHCFIISNRKEYLFEQIRQTKIYSINNALLSQRNRRIISKTNKNSPKQSAREMVLFPERNSAMPSKLYCAKISLAKTFKEINQIKKSISLSNLVPITNNNSVKSKDSPANDYMFLTDVFKKICTSKEKITQAQFEKIDFLLKQSQNRQYLSNLIFPESNISNEENHKQLTVSSYNDFLKLMIISLSYLTTKENLLGRVYTLACFSYYKVEKNDILKYIYEDLIVGAYPTKLWVSEEFWVYFFKGEIADSTNHLNVIDYLQDEISELPGFDEGTINESIVTLADIMLRLNLNKNFTKKIIFECILPDYPLSEEKVKDLREKLK